MSPAASAAPLLRELAPRAPHRLEQAAQRLAEELDEAIAAGYPPGVSLGETDFRPGVWLETL